MGEDCPENPGLGLVEQMEKAVKGGKRLQRRPGSWASPIWVSSQVVLGVSARLPPGKGPKHRAGGGSGRLG